MEFRNSLMKSMRELWYYSLVILLQSVISKNHKILIYGIVLTVQCVLYNHVIMNRSIIY